MERVLPLILAGGVGSRLMPLTRDRAKSGVPFGGQYRIIDFVLSNLVNSGIYKIKVLTQYKSQSLNTHITHAWQLARILDQYVELVPAQQRRGPQWYRGSADAVYQSLHVIQDERPELVAILGGDHIYKMDLRQLISFHDEKRADVTMAAIAVPLEDAKQFGVIEVDDTWRVVGFEEKPEDPRPIPGRPGFALVSMGNYLFNTEVLVKALKEDARSEASVHDFGKNIITAMVEDKRVFVYDFMTNVIVGQPLTERGYWRDVGTIDAYHKAHMDLISVTPTIDLYNRNWPIRTHYEHNPPAKFVHDDVVNSRVGQAVNSIVSAGCVISGGRIESSVLSPRVRINSYSQVTNSLLFSAVNVGRHSKINNAIIDKEVVIPANTVIGYDLDEDRKRFHVSESGIVVIPKGAKL